MVCIFNAFSSHRPDHLRDQLTSLGVHLTNDHRNKQHDDHDDDADADNNDDDDDGDGDDDACASQHHHQ